MRHPAVFARILFLIVLAPVVLVSCSDPAKARFERAEKAFLENRMDAALADYRSIPNDFPESRYAPTALLRQGDLFGSYYRNAEAAVEVYTSLLFNYPGSPEAPRALMRRAEIHLQQFFDYATSVADLELVRTQYPGFREMDGVMLLLAKAYRGLPDPVRQAQVLSELIEHYPDSPRAMEGRWMNAFTLLGQEQYADAAREFEKILSLVSDREEAARARWGLARAREGQGDLAAALLQYEAIREDWEDPEFIAEKVKRLKKRMETR